MASRLLSRWRRRRGTRRSRSWRRRYSPGLRTRMTLGFGLALLVLSGAFAVVTYFATSSYLMRQERSTLLQQALANGVFIQDDFLTGTVYQVHQLLAQLDLLSPQPASSSPNSGALIYFNQHWYSGGTVRDAELPSRFVSDVLAGKDVEQAFDIGPRPTFAVGLQIPVNVQPTRGTSGAVPSPQRDATLTAYVGVFDLSSTANSLHLLLAALVAVAVILTVLGAVLGRWAAGRALRPLRDASQAALAIAGGQLDTRLETAEVSDLALLASSFNRMADRLQQRIERDTRFTSDVSHELRSPLTVLANSVSVLEGRRDELPPRAQQALDLVAAEVRRFQRMVADLLEISRIDAGSADLDASDLEVGELVRRVSRLASRGSIHVEVPPEVATLHVAVDKRRFERIVANLVENAERYGGGASRIATESTGSCVRFLVDDEGPGVPAGDRERIFERFSRGSTAAGSRGAGGGTGLGLSLVAEHVKMHGGRVWVEDRPGGGARFVVELPLAASPEAPEVSHVAGTPDDTGEEPPPSPERVTSAAGEPRP